MISPSEMHLWFKYSLIGKHAEEEFAITTALVRKEGLVVIFIYFDVLRLF